MSHLTATLPLSATVDPFALGVLVGLLVAAPVFCSARLALAVLVQLAIAIATAILTMGFDVASSLLQNAIDQVSGNPKLAAGLLFGLAIAGIFAAILRYKDG